ncbi:BppU family phage baseplate upper protein [Enterococcus faecium]|uniref:BppU family phage baseplate upper protein n=1 Tax=Enterococcus faecium TaxID=1352 RepID=UPI0012E1668A|nr:BppU family phage baseplate upper protein [Enterococcus faecium]MUN71801.1 DUF2479 domain-containing protein [Enterococcus faecium]
MVQIIKSGTIKVPTQPKDFDLKATGLVFKSYDNQVALEFNVEKQDGTPADLLGANLRLLMFIYDEIDGTVTKEPIPFITKNLITESFLNGHVVYILPEAMKAYNGMVETYVYIEYSDGSTSDNLGFTFRMQRSAIDGLAQDKADYFIEDFKQLLDGVKQEATDAVNEALAKVEVVSENVSSAQNDLTILEDRIDQANQEIGDLGKLKKMYSNSIDFGDYDYSGNPNLMANINADSFSQGTGALSVVDDGDEVVVTLDPNHKLEVFKAKSQPDLLIGKTYTMSVEIMLEDDFTGDPSKIGLRYIKMPNWVSELYTRNTLTTAKGVWQKLTGTVKITATSDNAESWFIMLQNKDANNSLSGKLRLRHAKVEYGSEATPFQPNLLAEPYNMCREYPNENLCDPTVKFPIKSSVETLYSGRVPEDFVKGETYTVTIGATKPSTQSFGVYLALENHAIFKSVEGLPNTWTATLKIDRLGEKKNAVYIYQSPASSVGACQIDWLKIEKGDTRTPNISEYKYFGEGLKDSNNPNDYSWDIKPEYTEKGLNNTVSLTEPETVLGLKNFEDGLQIAGKEVATVPEDTGWVNLTAINGHSWNKQGQIRRIGKLVMFRGSLKGSTLSTQDFCTIPEGFRPSNPTDNYEYQFLLPPQSSNTLDNGGMAYIRPNGVCGLPSFRGTVNLFLAPIQYYID